MDTSRMQQDPPTFRETRLGFHGLWIGAVVGAFGAPIVARLLGLDFPTGGGGLDAIAGAAAGGFLGFIVGLIVYSSRYSR
jgi:biotin transporter BioY